VGKDGHWGKMGIAPTADMHEDEDCFT